MKFFADTRTKRNTAFAMLLVLVFALVSGVANACFLETPAHHSTGVKRAAAITIQVPAELVAHLDASAGHHDDSNGTKESCLKVCDDGTHTVPNTNTSIDHTDPGPALPVTTLWTTSPTVLSPLRRLDDLAIPLFGPPLRVRYSRLSL